MFPWFSFLTYAVVTAVTPGPNNIMSMSNGSRQGFLGALPFTPVSYTHLDVYKRQALPRPGPTGIPAPLA